jgi:hypothetical protein
MRMNISVPDTLAKQIRERNLPISAICQRALREEVDRLRAIETADEDMSQITVDVGEPYLTVGFTGRWLVEPDSDETRSGAAGADAGAYWGVARTKRGRIAVYTAHCNERWPAILRDYDSLDGAVSAGLPADIAALAARGLGEERVLWRYI